MKKQGQFHFGNTQWALLLGWITSLLLVVLAVGLVLFSTLGTGSYMESAVRKSNFGQTACGVMEQDFISFGAGAGFSAETMTAALSPEQVEQDMVDSIHRIYEGNLAAHEQNAIAETTYAAMEQEAAAKGVTLEGGTKDAVEIVAEAVRQEYVNYTTLPLRVQLGTLIKKVQKLVWIVAAGCALLAAASVLVLLRVTRRDPRMACRSLVFALAGAALVCLVIGLAVNPMMNLQRLSLEPASLKNLVVCYVEGIFGRFTVFAAIYFAVSLILGLLLRPRKHKKESAEY